MLHRAHAKLERKDVLPVLSLVGLVMGLALLVYGQQRSATETSSQPATNNPNAFNTNETSLGGSTKGNQEYQDAEFSFSLEFPASWSVERGESGEAENRIVNVSFKNEKASEGLSLVVIPLSMEGLVHETFSTEHVQTVEINGTTAEKFIGTNAKDGAPIDLLFFRKDGKVFVLNGPADVVERIGQTFRFT